MKRFLVLIILTTFLISFGCEGVDNNNTFDNQESKETVLARSDRMIRLNMPQNRNNAEAYSGPWNCDYNTLLGELPTEEKEAIEFNIVKYKAGFLVNGEYFTELPSYGERMTLDGDESTKRFHRWTFDCAFLKWAGKSKEYTVYVPETDKENTVLVLVDDSNQWLLARNDSFLHEKDSMRTEYFGACQIGGKYYTDTSVFPHIIGEIMNDDAVQATLPESNFSNNMPFTFECVSVPGLSLTVHVLAFPNGENYVYNHRIHSFVKLSDHMDFDITLNYRNSKIDDQSTLMNGYVLASQTPRYNSDGVYAKWSNQQCDYCGDYVFNGEAARNKMAIKFLTETEFEIDGEIYRRISIAGPDKVGWKIDLGFFVLYGVSENDLGIELLTNKETNAPDCLIISSEDERIFCMKDGLILPKSNDLQLDKLGLCWINNGIILPASDAAVLLTMLTDKESDTDIPVRFESTAYPGLSYCGWISLEQYQTLSPTQDGFPENPYTE